MEITIKAAEFCQGDSSLRYLDIEIPGKPKQTVLVPKELVNAWADALNQVSSVCERPDE